MLWPFVSFFPCKTFFVLPGAFFFKKSRDSDLPDIDGEKNGDNFVCFFLSRKPAFVEISQSSPSKSKRHPTISPPLLFPNGFLYYLPWQVSPISPEEKRNLEYSKGKERENGSHYFFLPPAQELKGPESTALCLKAPFLLLLSRFKIARFMRKKRVGKLCVRPSKKRRNVVVLKLKDWKLRPILSPPPLPWRSNYKSEKVVGGGFSSFLWTCVSDAFSRRRTQLFERRPIEREGGASSKLSQSDERTEEGEGNY